MRDFTIGGCIFGLGLVCLVAGCPQQQVDSSAGSDQLTADQAAAIDAAIGSIESLTGSLNTTQDATGGESQASRTTSACPEASFSADTSNGLALAVSLDFGDGCDVVGSTDYSCSGSISGTYSQSAQTFDAQFGALTCNGYTLEGSLSFQYEITTTTIGVTGAWDIRYADGSSSVETAGTGAASYDSNSAATTFSTFEGDVTSDGQTYGLDLLNIVTSITNNGNFIPQAGAMTLSGQTFDSVRITFNSTSPSTGEVEVSINDGPSFAYNLFGN